MAHTGCRRPCGSDGHADGIADTVSTSGTDSATVGATGDATGTADNPTGTADRGPEPASMAEPTVAADLLAEPTGSTGATKSTADNGWRKKQIELVE